MSEGEFRLVANQGLSKMTTKTFAAYMRSPKFIYVYDTGVSALMAAVFIAAAGPIADFIGWPGAVGIIHSLGVFLISWALFNYALGTAEASARSAVIANIVGDGLWALASIALLLTHSSLLNGVGQALVIVQALFVAGVFVTKVRGWPALMGEAKTSSPLGKVTIS